MKVFLTAIAIALSIIGKAQTNFSLFSEMDGVMHLTNGTTNFWGYGYTDQGVMTLPAPLLRIPKGDDVNVEFFNPSPESHTIHWHGLDVDQVNDGVPQTSFYVTPGETVNYNFNASFEGTYLYHCHVTTTLHLTMGMYGMVVVEAPDNQLFEGGPVYDSSFEFLMSDLEKATNDFPALAFPFHEIRPDYFMVNGKSGFFLGGAETSVTVGEGDKVALRVGSMAYSKVNMVIPESLNAEVWMSDGRALPSPVSVTELEIYPGERFSIMLDPDLSALEDIEVQYYSMINGEYLASNIIEVNESPTEITELDFEESMIIYPNPASQELRLSIPYAGMVSVVSFDGREVMSVYYNSSNSLIVSKLSSGLYALVLENGVCIPFIKQ